MVMRVNSFRQGKVASYYVYPRVGSTGFPDLVAMKGTEYFLIEVKNTHVKKLRGSQKHFALFAEHYCIPLIIANSVDDVKSWLHR